VQSADFFTEPVDRAQIERSDEQFYELFCEEAPEKRSALSATLEEAIALHQVEFSSWESIEDAD
jgi:hypothetical protein